MTRDQVSEALEVIAFLIVAAAVILFLSLDGVR